MCLTLQILVLNQCVVKQQNAGDSEVPRGRQRRQGVAVPPRVQRGAVLAAGVREARLDELQPRVHLRVRRQVCVGAGGRLLRDPHHPHPQV